MEEKKELLDKELKEEELDTVVGGKMSIATGYTCNACGYTWHTSAKSSCCPSCTSTNISKT